MTCEVPSSFVVPCENSNTLSSCSYCYSEDLYKAALVCASRGLYVKSKRRQLCSGMCVCELMENLPKEVCVLVGRGGV